VYIITLAMVRFQTVTSCPDLSRLLTMAEPIVPRPRNPIFSDVATTCFDQTLSGFVVGNMSGINCIAQTKNIICSLKTDNCLIIKVLKTCSCKQKAELIKLLSD